MAKAYIFYNPLAGQGRVLEDLDGLEFVLDCTCVRCDMTKPETYCDDLFAMEAEDILVLCGGDGTLNRFVNLVESLPASRRVAYYPAGEHNDFALDFGRRYGNNPFSVTEALQDLAGLRIGSRAGSFLTGTVFSCLDRQQGACSIKLSADRALHHYETVRFAAVLRGRHCCGGLTPDPKRQRTDCDLSCVVIHGCGRRKARYLLSRLQRGLIPNSRHLTILKGTDFRLTFDTPVTLLTDGEAQTGVTDLAAWRKEA